MLKSFPSLLPDRHPPTFAVFFLKRLLNVTWDNEQDFYLIVKLSVDLVGDTGLDACLLGQV